MKCFKKVLLLLLATLMLLTSCNNPSDEPDDAEQTPVCTTLRIVIPHNSEVPIKNLAARLQNALKDEWGEDIPIVSEAAGEGTKDILFGITTRKASLDADAKLYDDADYVIDFSENGGVIAGRNAFALESAVQTVVNSYRNGDYSNMQTLTYQDAEENKRPQPIAHFTFSESDGKEAVDSVTGKKGELVNASFSAGLNGNGLYFSDSSDGYLDLGRGYAAELLGGKSEFTFNLWVMPYQIRSSTLFTFYCRSNRSFMSCTFKDSYFDFYVKSVYSDAELGGRYSYSIDTNSIVSSTNGFDQSNLPNNTGVWQMLTFAIDFKNDKVAVYINGKQQQPQSEIKNKFSSDTLVVGETKVSDVIGGDPTVKNFSFMGIIDEVSFYDRKLTTNEIKTLANARTDRNSPIYDELCLRAIAKKLGADAALALDTNLYCSNGMQNLLDPDNYTAKSLMKDGKWMVPEAFAIDYFGAEATKNCTASDGYYALDALCEAAGKRLMVSETLKMAVVSSETEWFELYDKAYLARMYALMTDHSYDAPISNTEQSRVVVAEADGKEIRNCFGPHIFIYKGTIYASMDNRKGSTYIYTSTDGGKTFQKLSVVPAIAGASWFEIDGIFYLLGMSSNKIVIKKSTDEGKTWSDNVIIPYNSTLQYCIPSKIIRANGRIYKAYEGMASFNWGENEDKRSFVISAPETANLMDPNSWTVSNFYNYGTDDLMAAIDKPYYTDKTYIQEGCLVIDPNGDIRNVVRIDSFPHYGHAVTMKVTADGSRVVYNKNEALALINIPTGADKFHIEYDETSGYYISLLNIKTTDYRPYQRNVLALAISKDLENWEVVTTLLVDRTMMNEYVSMMMHAFQYVHFAFDGDDLIYLVREAMGDSDNYHDNNYLTFYRLKDFRSYLPK
ncbi:MAG: hypothetical protein IJX19_12375 [Clostridia bacterium]|nr:hypothetical protein [Clostridia bacterium]